MEWFEKGKYQGFDYEVLKAIAEHANLKVKWKHLPWETAVPALGAGKIDVLSGGMGLSCKREKIIDFSGPYYSEELDILVREDSDLNVVTALCCGAKIGTLAGAISYKWMKKIAENPKVDVTVTPYESTLLAVKDVVSGRIDTVLISVSTGKKFSQKYPIKVVGKSFSKPYPLQRVYGVTKGDPHKLLPIINEGLKWLWETGKFQRLWADNMIKGSTPMGPVPLKRTTICE